MSTGMKILAPILGVVLAVTVIMTALTIDANKRIKNLENEVDSITDELYYNVKTSTKEVLTTTYSGGPIDSTDDAVQMIIKENIAGLDEEGIDMLSQKVSDIVKTEITNEVYKGLTQINTDALEEKINAAVVENLKHTDLNSEQKSAIVDAVEANVLRQVNATLTTLQTDLTTTKAKLAAIESAATKAESTATSLGSRAQSLESSIDTTSKALKEADSAMQKDISDLRSQITSLNSSVNTLTVKVNQLSGGGSSEEAGTSLQVLKSQIASAKIVNNDTLYIINNSLKPSVEVGKRSEFLSKANSYASMITSIQSQITTEIGAGKKVASDALISQCANVMQSIVDLSLEVSDNKLSVDNILSDVSAMSTKINTIEDTLADNNTAISSLKTATDNLAAADTALETLVGTKSQESYDNAISALNTAIGTLPEGSSVIAELTAAKSSIESAYASGDEAAIASAVSQASSLIGTAKTDLEGQISSLNSLVTGLNGRLGTVETTLTNVETSLTDNTEAINDLKSSQAKLETANTALTELVSTKTEQAYNDAMTAIDQAIGSLPSGSTVIEQLENAKAELQQAYEDGNDEAIASAVSQTNSLLDNAKSDLDGKISDLNGAVTTINGNITTLQGDVSTANTNISTLQSDMNSVQSSLDGKLNAEYDAATNTLKLSLTPTNSGDGGQTP